MNSYFRLRNMSGLLSCVSTMMFMIIALLLRVPMSLSDSDHDTKTREGKFLSPFQVVTFPNAACVGSSKNGTCYTSDECNNKGGTSDGTCASGFGVCCTFTISCGSTSRENCTYIQSNSPSAGECRHTLCPCNDNICQLRLDFDTFVIAGPSTNMEPETYIKFGSVTNSATVGRANSFASQCLTDSFSVSNSAGSNPAPICGTNSGQHMYVDVDRSGGGTGCNHLDFQLGSQAVSTTIPNRQWSIKVSQIACDSLARAPSGCTQYFFDSSDTVQTYNYDGGQHLAFQRQSICVRRAKGQCRICWSAVTPEDFAVSGPESVDTPGSGIGFTSPSICCGYMTTGNNPTGFDCLQIPGAMTKTDGALVPNSRICGRSVGLVQANGINGIPSTGSADGDVTICSTQTPFVIRFVSDGYEEAANEIVETNKGFNLAYMQDSTNC